VAITIITVSVHFTMYYIRLFNVLEYISNFEECENNLV